MERYKKYFAEDKKPTMYHVARYGSRWEATPLTFAKGKALWPSGDPVPSGVTILKHEMKLDVTPSGKALKRIPTRWAFYTYRGGRNFHFSDYARDSELEAMGIEPNPVIEDTFY